MPSDEQKYPESYSRLRWHHYQQCHRYHHERFRKYHHYFRYIRLIFVLFNIAILYLLFSWVGFAGIGIFFAILLVGKEIFHFIFLIHLEKRIIQPIDQLKHGIDKIAKGNYDVEIECDIPNDLGLLITSFNEMARELHESEKLKTEYEENRKSLITNISHDLKTPITAVQGYIEAILDGTATSPEIRDQYLRIIHRNTVYINRLIDDLFLFSKLDMQKLDFHYEKVQISRYLDDVMEEYRFELEGKNVEFHYLSQLDSDVYVNLDRKRFRQALNNIINNAVIHGPDNNLLIQSEAFKHNDVISIVIRDNGPGIPEDKLPYIFDRFYRINTERTKDLTSTGLGLAITKELIEAHGGTITVSSSGSSGTCFTITLPVLSQQKEGGCE